MKLLLSFLLGGAVLFAGPVTANLTFVNAGSPIQKDSRGYDVGPYTLGVNGTNQLALCVDDSDWSQSSWTANLSSLSSGDMSSTYHTGDLKEYEEDAYIFTQILKGSDRVNLQDAAWDIIDDSITNASQIPAGLSSGVVTDIENALNNYSSINFSNFDVVSGTNPNAENRPQEFLICDTPEPASFALLGIGLLLAGAFRVRRGKETSPAIS